jgi:hypothetical protein
MDTQEPRRGGRLLSILGRFGIAVLLTILGGIAGLAVGLYRGITAANALPPAPATMGFESAGLAPAIVIAVDSAMGGVVGAIAGLVIGLGLAIFWPRSRPDGGAGVRR